MSAHQFGYEYKLASETGHFDIPDPGNAGRIVATGGINVCSITSAGTETRTVADPHGPGQRLIISMFADGGDVTITFTNDIGGTTNTLATNVATFDDPGDWLELVSVPIFSGETTADSTGFAWRAVPTGVCALS